VDLTGVIFFDTLVKLQAKYERSKKMDISTTTTTVISDIVNTSTTTDLTASQGSSQASVSSNPNELTDGDIAICTLLMVMITLQLLGASWNIIVGIKNKYPVYD